MTSRNESGSAAICFKIIATVAGVLLSVYLLWKLRSLIVPITVGGMMAYICRPLISHLEQRHVPRGLAVGLLLVVFVLAVLFVAGRMNTIMPSELQAIDLRVQTLHKLNESYDRLMGLDPSLTRGNLLYRFSHEELDPVVERINLFLALTRQEESLFLASRPHLDAAQGSDRLLDYHRANIKTLAVRAPGSLSKAEGAPRGAAPAATPRAPAQDMKTPLSTAGRLLSAWFMAPLVFLFLLRDTGEIKRALLSMVPNRLFEPALTVLADLDHGLGDYLRGIFLECVALGFTVALLVAIVGVSPRWAIAIGIFTAMTNVIPYMGFAAALLGGLAYALLTEEIHPLLPMVNTENFALWVIAAVGVAEILKNIFYEPFVLGGAVKLHPLVVVIGIVGGGMLFDFAGVLLAIPVIAVSKVFISSAVRQLKAYGLM